MRDGLLGRPQGVGCVDGDDRRYERCSAVTAKAHVVQRVVGSQEGSVLVGWEMLYTWFI